MLGCRVSGDGWHGLSQDIAATPRDVRRLHYRRIPQRHGSVACQIELTVLSASRQAVRAVRRRGRSHRHLALGPKLVDRQHWAAALSMPWLFSSLRPEIWPSRRRAAPQGE